jgi:beta-ribofuranosylaminobenzene 5'-phosphate synthase
MPCVVHVTAPSRLHFGLWSLGGTEGRQFGGVGAMIQQPALRLSLQAANRLGATGPVAERAVAFACRWAEFHRYPELACRIEVHNALPEHAGLGSGTQLALAVAAGLNALCGLPSQSPQELALSVGRGLRSGVGTYGFVFGGLIVEQGKLPDEPISPLDCRIDLPDAWRFVLVQPRSMAGLAGEEEIDAFSALPSVLPSVTEELIAEVRDRLVPAAAMGDFDAFAQSLYRYGRLSGECFAARQGGPYNGPLLTALVEAVRGLGYAGVGQSSWGPTIFVAIQSQPAAECLLQELQRLPQAADLELTITSPENRGARIEISDGGTPPRQVTYQPP